MKTIIDYILIILSFLIAIFFYTSFDVENILWNRYKRETINQETINQNKTKEYTGSIPDKDITVIKSKEEWDKVVNTIEYISVIPKSIYKTNIYSLAKWVDFYTKQPNGTSKRKLEEVKKTSFDISSNYIPFYIIELEDGSHILAQMNRGIAKKIQNGERVLLPLGKKIGFSKKAKNLLKPICEEWEVETDYVLYTIDNTWQADNKNKIWIIKLTISALLFIILAISLQLLYDKLSKIKTKIE